MKTKLFALLLLAGSSLLAETHVHIGIGVGGYGYGYYPPPPPPVVAYMEPCPGPGYYWVPGYWYSAGPSRYWRRGYWTRPAYFAPPRWEGPRYYQHRRHDDRYRRGYRR